MTVPHTRVYQARLASSHTHKPSSYRPTCRRHTCALYVYTAMRGSTTGIAYTRHGAKNAIPARRRVSRHNHNSRTCVDIDDRVAYQRRRGRWNIRELTKASELFRTTPASYCRACRNLGTAGNRGRPNRQTILDASSNVEFSGDLR